MRVQEKGDATNWHGALRSVATGILDRASLRIQVGENRGACTVERPAKRWLVSVTALLIIHTCARS